MCEKKSLLTFKSMNHLFSYQRINIQILLNYDIVIHFHEPKAYKHVHVTRSPITLIQVSMKTIRS